MIPEFAVVGHPNEGKSSVVSTLTEDDQIKISPVPGETVRSTYYTVKIDGREIIRFIDTPGFQVPRQALAWFKSCKSSQDKIIDDFIANFKSDPFFADECELLAPIARGAGIIYVVDASRPVREDDLAEMEILRLTGRPRMAVINSKNSEKDYTAQWKQEFRKQFNVIRVFNSNTACFSERMRMLESLRAIDQEWENDLTEVIQAFEQDWEKRNQLAASYISETIGKCLSFSLSRAISDKENIEHISQGLNEKYQAHIKKLEKQMFNRIRGLFKHQLYEYRLPEASILQYDLFSKQTWEFLGLTQKQLTAAGAIAGGTVGAAVDVATAGISFGVFSVLGGVLGAGSTLFGAKKLSGRPAVGSWFGGDKFKLGPNKNPQFLYILLDRVLIYYAHMVSRPHGRRDQVDMFFEKNTSRKGYSSHFSSDQTHICNRFLKTASGQSIIKDKKAFPDFERFIEKKLNEISR